MQNNQNKKSINEKYTANVDVFDVWNLLKKEIEGKDSSKMYHAREIWWSAIGKNIGSEQDGKNNNFERPVLVLKKWNKDFFLGIPMTTKHLIDEEDRKFYFEYYANEEGNSYFMLTQIKVFSSKRLIRKVGSVRGVVFREIQERLKNLLFDI